MSKIEYALNKPYPIVKVEKPNLAYASILLNDYAGITSELTAICQYSYQFFIKDKTSPKLALMLEKIAQVEMKHLELLGKTIFLLGVNPKYKYVDITGRHLKSWEGKLVNYETDEKKLLIENIKSEYRQIDAYEKHIKIINDIYIKKLLRRIIEDEKIHIICFKNYLCNLK